MSDQRDAERAASFAFSDRMRQTIDPEPDRIEALLDAITEAQLTRDAIQRRIDHLMAEFSEELERHAGARVTEPQRNGR